MSQWNKKNEYFWTDYDKIWLIFESKYRLNSVEIQQFLKYMLKKYYNIKKITPRPLPVREPWYDLELNY